MVRTFSGGVHPPGFKDLSKDQSFLEFPLPDELVCFVSQHIGAPCKPIVKRNDKVKKGQIIADSTGFVSSPVHAPTSGKVKKIEPRLHPQGRKVEAIIIEPDGDDSWEENLSKRRQKIKKLAPKELVEIIQNSGLVGMGGAAFPSHVKLSPPKNKKIEHLILNGVECEPYLTCDHRLMLTFPSEIIKGAKIIQKILDAKEIHIGIEANKKDAFREMKQHAENDPSIHVHCLKVKYPQGGEKQLIKTVLNRDVPSGGLPMDVGVVVHNVMTTYYIYKAVYFNEPLIERYITVTGDGIEKPQNLLVPLGIPVKKILEHAGLKDNVNKIIMGGPMTGTALYSLDVPIIKGTSGLVVLENVVEEEYQNCIRCGTCIEHCPMKLLPNDLSVILEKASSKFDEKYIDLAKEYNIMDCMECGACAYVCPAKRPIVQFVKFGKAQLMKRKK